MPAITAALVNDLRGRTGLGMNECKRYLVEADGDIDKAMENIRKAGVKTSIAARTAGEGRCYVQRSADGKSAAVAEVLCNTDFTARSEPVAAVLKAAADVALAGGDPTADESIKNAIIATAQKTGENVTLGRVKVVKSAGKVGTFFYSVTGKIGVLVAVDKDAPDELLSDIGMHVCAFKPVASGLSRDSLPADLVANERTIAVEQAMQTGKPQQIAEKIAEGKLNAFFKERVLLEQDFVNPDKFKGTIADYAKKHGVTVTEYYRLEVGAE